MDRADLPELLAYWRTKPAHSDQVAAVDIIEALLLELRTAENQRADFRRQLTAEREGRMGAERIADEVRARNRELEAAQSATTAPVSSADAWPTKDDYLDLVKQHGELVNAWGAVRKHIGTDIIPGSRFERLIWLAEAAAAAPTGGVVDGSNAGKGQS